MVAGKEVGWEIWASKTHKIHSSGARSLGERGPYLHDLGWIVLPLSISTVSYHMLAGQNPFAEFLSKLEGKLTSRPQREDPESYKIAEFFNRILSTMREDHAKLLTDTLREMHEHYERDMAKRRRGEPGIGPWSNWHSPGGRLFGVANLMLIDHLSGEDKPVALPPEVADVYLQDDEVGPYHDCEDCSYNVPVGRRRYFERCPLCGGRTGWYAYYEKHKKNGVAAGAQGNPIKGTF